ncbi:MAG: hypothetical protein JXM70_09495 [Pirellulales bacterium]|nr:hypothetical protein [Pirellulales bacterium]
MLTKHEFFCTVILVLSTLAAGNRGLFAAPPEAYRDAAATFYDNVLKHGRDNYGQKTPLFADGIDMETKSALVAPNGTVICNFISQQNLLRGLVALSRTTGDEKYRQAAAEATKYVLTHLVSPKSGLIYWGGHVYWDLKTDSPRFDPHNSHELKHDFPYYDLMFEVDPQATRKFIERYWLAHVDLDSPWLMFGRHAKMEQSEPRGRVNPRELAFTLSGADLFYAAAIMFSKTQDPMWRDRAVKLAERFAELKDPKTGLASELLGAHDPTFDRKAYQLSLGHLGVGVPNLLIDYGRRSDSYALCQLYLSERLSGEPGEKFRTWAIEDLIAYAKHCYDPKSRAFFEMRRTDTGKRIHFSQTRWIPTDPQGHYILPQRFYPNKSLPLLFLAYARGYKLSGNPAVKQTVETLLDLMEIRRGKPVTLAGVADEYRKSDFAACLVQGLLDLHEADRDSWYLEAARGIADDALDQFYNDGFFFDWPKDFQFSRVNQALPLALTRLYSVLSGKRIDLPQDIGAYGMAGFTPNLISGIDGALPLRYMWSKHHVDIVGGNLSARVGDCFPHSGKLDGLFNYPGVWRLGCSPSKDKPSQANLLDNRKGMVFDPLRKARPAQIRKLSDREAAIVHWQFKDSSEKQKYLGIRMNYRIEAPNILNWTLRITPLEENYGNLSLRAMAYLNEKASTEIMFAGENGLTPLTLSGTKETVLGPKSGSGAGYRRPLFYSRIDDALLVFMFKPGAPVDLLAAGASQENPGGLRGFVWNVANAKKDQQYKLEVRIQVFPVSQVDELLKNYERWTH